MEAHGGNGGNQWDDGSKHDGVTKIHIAAGGQGIEQIKFDYVQNGEPEEGSFHGVKGRSIISTIVINYPDEYLVSVEAWSDSSNIIQGIKFQTNKTTSDYIGYEFSGDGRQFSLQAKDKKIIGFHGSADSHLNSLGAYFAPISSLLPHYSVTNIYIAAGTGGIEQIKFDNVGGGETKEGTYHGVKGRHLISTVVISQYPSESPVFVENWYDSSNVFQGIKFKTDKNSSDFLGYPISGEDYGTPFTLQYLYDKIVGVYKFPDFNLIQLAPPSYFVLNLSSLLTKVEAQGGNGGTPFDDGVFDDVRKVYIGQGDSGVAYVKFEYEKNGKRETREHGKMTLLGTEEFEVDSDDYITSVEVSLDKVFGFNSEIVTAVIFKTFKGNTSQPFGMVTEKKFELKDGRGGKLVGFLGNASDVIYALGAYFVPTPTPLTPPILAKRLEAKGGNGGAPWDDGAFDGVRKILVGQGNYGVAFVKFEYEKGAQVIIGDGHGKETLLGTDSLDYPSEYITSVEGYSEKVFGVEGGVVTSLTFKTNKQTSQPFGLTSGELFQLNEEGYKIVGFHGKADDVVHKIGVYVVPIITN